MPVETKKQCTKCKRSKSLRCFQRDDRYKSGYVSWCRQCKNLHSYRRSKRDHPNRLRDKNRRNGRAYRERRQIFDPLVTRRSHLKRRFGITIEAFDALLEAQGGCCAICETPQAEDSFERLAVDHDHETGKVRGIICRRCNSGLGMFRDNPELLKKATEYLAKSEVVLSL